MKFTKHYEAEHGYHLHFHPKMKQRIRIYRKDNQYEYYDVTKGLKAFNDNCIALQYIWVLSLGIKLC